MNMCAVGLCTHVSGRGCPCKDICIDGDVPLYKHVLSCMS